MKTSMTQEPQAFSLPARSAVGAPGPPGILMKGSSLSARALPSHSRDLPLCAKLGAEAAARRASFRPLNSALGRIPALPCPPLRSASWKIVNS